MEEIKNKDSENCEIRVQDEEIKMNMANENNEAELDIITNIEKNLEDKQITSTLHTCDKDNNIKTDDIKNRILSNLCDSDTDVDTENHTLSVENGLKDNEDTFSNEKTDMETNIEVECSNDAEKYDTSTSNKENGSNNIDSIGNIAADDIKQNSILTALCDPESDDDLHANDTTENVPKPLPYRKKTKSKNESEEVEAKKMNAKEAIEQRKEIQSESQRMLRELNVSLPYHRPKQRSLRDFLKNRPKFADSIPVNSGTSPSIAIKMSTQQLETISKTLKEREKTVEEFFKSDSEDSDIETEHRNEITETCSNEVKTVITDNTNELDSTTISEKANDEVKEVIPDKTNGTNITDIQKVPHEEMPMEVETIINESKQSAEATIENATKDNSLEYDFNLDDLDESGELEKDESLPEERSIKILQDIAIKENVVVSSQEHDKTNESVIDDNIDFLEQENSTPRFDKNISLKEGLEKATPSVSGGLKFVIESDEDEDTKPKAVSQLVVLKEKLSNVTPRLSGGPNFVIDLDQNVTKPDAISQLVERFIQHTSKKTPSHKSKVELNILSVSGAGEIHKEKVAVTVADTEVPEIIEKPGLKLQMLRRDLEGQMAQRRTELWKQKQQTVRDSEESVYDGEKSVCGLDDTEIDEDEELILESDTECVNDDEADKVSDVENEDFNESEDEEDEKGSENEKEEDCSSDGEQESEVEEHSILKSRKRIINILDDDSDDESNVTAAKESNQLDSTVSWDDENSPLLGQRMAEGTPQRPKMESNGELFLTPINNLTGLQSLNSGSKFLYKSLGSPIIKESSPPSTCSNWSKKLFAESQNSCENMEEIADLCSGKFPTQTQQNMQVDATPSEECSTQELLDICSGNFTGLPEKSEKSVDSNKTNNDSIEEPSNSTCLTTFSSIKDHNINSQDDHDKIITQLIDEDELEEFKKKFISPVKSSQQPAESSQQSHIDFDSSDEEEEIRQPIKKKLTYNAILDSDDEDEAENVNPINYDSNEEEIDEDVEYDSEENEVDVTKPAPKMKIADFFENEAELSESEWGSEDEDEKHLDTMDFEVGDTDKLDENKIRSDLEKIHMRRILDDDTREVKILQEMLLEDGELHGAGRQKQFRWKNNAGDENDKETSNADDSEKNAYEEDENEEEWRKKRFERDLFLKKNGMASQHDENDDITVGLKSKEFKLGDQTKLNLTINNGINKNHQFKTSGPKQLFSLHNKRGSFLSRNDKVLSRVAEFANNSSKVGTGKSSTKIVFQTIAENDVSDNKKRKIGSDGTPIAIKKLRLNNFSPAAQNKSNTLNSRKKSLFNT